MRKEILRVNYHASTVTRSLLLHIYDTCKFFRALSGATFSREIKMRFSPLEPFDYKDGMDTEQILMSHQCCIL